MNYISHKNYHLFPLSPVKFSDETIRGNLSYRSSGTSNENCTGFVHIGQIPISRRRKKTDENTKVVAAAAGDGIDSVPCHASYNAK